MSSVIIAGNTSGTITLDAPNVAGTTTLTLPTTNGTVLTSASSLTSSQLPAGSVLQVVNATYSTTTSTSGTTYIDTGLSASITPSSSSSKIFVIFHQGACGNSNANNGLRIQLLRSSTSILILGTAVGYGPANANATVSSAYLDSPSTTSSVTYKTQFRINDPIGTATVQNDGCTSTITLMEIKG
jgi:hypothetical protein